MTRFFIFIGLLLCLTTLATAQTSRNEIGVILGPTLTNLHFNDSDLEYDTRISALVGLKYRYIATQKLSLTFAPSFERKGFKLTSIQTDDIGTEIGEWTDYWDYDYLIFPLSARYDLGDFFVSGGGYYGYLVRQHINIGLESLEGVIPDSYIEYYSRSDAGVSASAGFRVALGTNWFLDTEVKYSHGLANIFDRTSNADPNVNTRSTALIFGLIRQL